MGKYYDLTDGGARKVFGRRFNPARPRKTDTYNVWYLDERQYNKLTEEFGEEDSKVIMECIKKTFDLLFTNGPLTLEEGVVELNHYENSYLHIVRDADDGVFVAVTIDDTVYMVLLAFKTGSRDTFGKKVEEFRDSL